MSLQQTRDSIHCNDLRIMEPQDKELYMKAIGRIILNMLKRQNARTQEEYWKCAMQFQVDTFRVLYELMVDIKPKYFTDNLSEQEREEQPRENQKSKNKKQKTSKSSQRSAKSQVVKRSKSKQPIAAINPTIKKVKTKTRFALRQGLGTEQEGLTEIQKAPPQKAEQVKIQQVRHEKKYKNKHQTNSKGKGKKK